MYPRATLAALLVGIAASGHCAADDSEVTVRLSDVRFGIVKAARESPFGARAARTHDCRKRIVERSDRVPMRLGTLFGFQGRIEANRGHLLQLTVVWELPPQAIQGGPDPLTRDGYVTSFRNGEEFYTCFLLEAPRELVPGVWTLRIALTGIDNERFRRGPNAQAPYWIPLYEKQFVMEGPRGP